MLFFVYIPLPFVAKHADGVYDQRLCFALFNSRFGFYVAFFLKPFITALIASPYLFMPTICVESLQSSHVYPNDNGCEIDFSFFLTCKQSYIYTPVKGNDSVPRGLRVNGQRVSDFQVCLDLFQIFFLLSF